MFQGIKELNLDLFKPKENLVLNMNKDTDGRFKLTERVKLLNPVCDVTRNAPSQPRSTLRLPAPKPFKGAVYLQGSCFYGQAVKMFETAGYEVTPDFELADIICWLGGSDINPRIYKEKKCGASYWSDEQDKADIIAVERAGNRFKIGICRGAQLLNCVPNGGSLWQDTDNHGGGVHKVTDVVTTREYLVNSIHHQQLRLTNEAELVAFTDVSSYKECEPFTWHKGSNHPIPEEPLADKDVEAAWYEKTNSLLVQWHPEVGGRDSTSYFFDLVNRYNLAA